MDPARPLWMLYKGLRNPRRVPVYLKRKLYPSKYALRTVENGVVTWNTERGFDWGDGETPPEISAINYHIVRALRDDLAGNEYGHAVEIGCGYGRVTPWLSEFADQVTGVEPNDAVLSLARRYYPGINTVSAAAQDLPLPADSADLLFTRSVLQHIPPDEVDRVADEMERVTTGGAHMLLYEATTGTQRETFYPRSESEYAGLFDGFRLVSSRDRETPGIPGGNNRRRLLFERRG